MFSILILAIVWSQAFFLQPTVTTSQLQGSSPQLQAQTQVIQGSDVPLQGSSVSVQNSPNEVPSNAVISVVQPETGTISVAH